MTLLEVEDYVRRGVVVLADDADLFTLIDYVAGVYDQGFGRYQGRLDIFVSVQYGPIRIRVVDEPWEPRAADRVFVVPFRATTGHVAVYCPEEPEGHRFAVAPGEYSVTVALSLDPTALPDADEVVSDLTLYLVRADSPVVAHIKQWNDLRASPPTRIIDPAPAEED